VPARLRRVQAPMTVERRHERDYADIRTHLRHDHGVQAYGTVRAATFLLHHHLHAGTGLYKGHRPVVEHTHAERQED
jgi:hypothetical protein